MYTMKHLPPVKPNLLDKKAPGNHARDLARSLRARTIVLSWIIYSCVIIAQNGADFFSIGVGLILFVSMYGIVALQNDINDTATDRINKRHDIPYSRGHLSEMELLRTMLVLSIVATASGVVLNYQVLAWVGLYLLLGYFYSGPANIKSRGIYAALLLGICYGAMPWLIGASVTGQIGEINLLIVAFISFIFSSGIIVIKDFKDVVGDRITHKNTLLVIRGAQYTRGYYLLMTSLAYVATTIFCVVNHLAFLSLLGIGLGAINYWLLISRAIFNNPHSRSKRGKWARVLFFAYILIVYFTITFISQT